MIEGKNWQGQTYYHDVKIEDLLGRTFDEVYRKDGEEEITFEDAEGNRFVFNHHQDCCENVYIESIVGDLSDLEGEPLLVAEESIDTGEGSTWTFYKFATRKGYVDVRWNGESNGYYSESVDLNYYTA